MPRKTAKPRYVRRKKPAYKKYNKSGAKRQTTVLRGLNPIPSRLIVKMKYAEAVTLDTPGMGVYRWRLNSIFDPNFTGVGHQPYSRDTYETLYNRYRVISAKYVVSGISDTNNIQVACLPSNLSAPPISDVSEARENPRCQYLVQNPGGALKTMTGKVYIPNLVGKTAAQYMAGENYQSEMSTNPVEFALLHVFTQGLNDDGTTNVKATINVLIEYTVELFDVKSLDQS